MRELKFRAWMPEHKSMFYFANASTDDEYNNLTFDWVENGETVQAAWNEGKALPHDESMILMQYTGLQDKNGKEIYEEDIISTQFYPEPFLVEWENDAWICDGSLHPELKCIGWCFPNDTAIEVIGNIYENPELL